MIKRLEVGKMRNRPCYCGSGKKYKVCHLPEKEGFIKNEQGLLVNSRNDTLAGLRISERKYHP